MSFFVISFYLFVKSKIVSHLSPTQLFKRIILFLNKKREFHGGGSNKAQKMDHASGGGGGGSGSAQTTLAHVHVLLSEKAAESRGRKQVEKGKVLAFRKRGYEPPNWKLFLSRIFL